MAGDDTGNAPTTQAQNGTPRKPRARADAVHERMLELVVGGASVEDAGKACGLARRTAFRWAERHAAELRRARSALLDRAVGKAHARLADALGVLHELATDEGGAAAADGSMVRCRAAESLIGAVERLSRIGDMDARLAALEASQLPQAARPSGLRRFTVLTNPEPGSASEPSTAAPAAIEGAAP